MRYAAQRKRFPWLILWILISREARVPHVPLRCISPSGWRQLRLLWLRLVAAALKINFNKLGFHSSFPASCYTLAVECGFIQHVADLSSTCERDFVTVLYIT